MNKRKTLNDLKVGDKVYYNRGGLLKEMTLKCISLEFYEFSDFEKKYYSKEDLTRWNIDLKDRYSDKYLIHLNKIDALKELKKIKIDSLENYKKQFYEYLEDIKKRQQSLFELDLEILKETQIQK
jgi:hypothetical protein